MKEEKQTVLGIMKKYPDIFIKETGYIGNKGERLHCRTALTFVPREVNGETRLFEVRADVEINQEKPFCIRELDWHFAMRKFYTECIDVSEGFSNGNSHSENGIPDF